ncbi:MAG: glycogen synthase GlgA [Pseudomonadota bacterium]
MHNILFVTSEAHPLIKTGGLADVSGSLPSAIATLQKDIRIFMPGYRDARDSVENTIQVADVTLQNKTAKLLETTLPGSPVKVWLLDCPSCFDRAGNPYQAEDGSPWPDNAERFAFFCRVAVEAAMNRLGLGWAADVVHCTDWQNGLVPAMLSLEGRRPATVFTIHNLAYQGIFPFKTLESLDLPRALWGPDALEFHQQMSFIKGGLTFADRINTVSPSYAREIQTADFGYGLEGLLKHRQSKLTGILNGIDTDQWNPSSDKFIEAPFTRNTLEEKIRNKQALREELSLPETDMPLLALISRLVHQKGIDLILQALPKIIDLPAQFVLLGSGDSSYVEQLLYWARRYPDKISVNIGYNEGLSHRIEAGADIFLMPSRFEPCGLNQMYSQRYGTVPVVRRVGGLADTVIDATPSHLANGSATGIVFDDAAPGSLLEAVKRAAILFSDEDRWKKMQVAGMNTDFSWKHSAEQYLALYRLAMDDNGNP